ncbi:hypothetical protein LP420_39025 [Massilia sp. B-10]|nr:hypothetical protein LP420_39025 [Massilia sp. B-10]UUZ54214.1 hypothetical protein LP419_38470 [Massilia sp. H-1]
MADAEVDTKEHIAKGTIWTTHEAAIAELGMNLDFESNINILLTLEKLAVSHAMRSLAKEIPLPLRKYPLNSNSLPYGDGASLAETAGPTAAGPVKSTTCCASAPRVTAFPNALRPKS